MSDNLDAVRPDKDQTALDEAFAKDNAWFKSNEHRFIEGKCPVCGGRENSVPLETSRFRGAHPVPSYRRCESCKTLFLDRHLDEEGYAEFYGISEVMRVFSDKIYKDSAQNRKDRIYKPRLERLLRAAKNAGVSSGGSYLEIAAGSGAFADMVNKSGYFSKTYVIEPNPLCADECRALGFDVMETVYEKVDQFPSDVKVCALFECLANIVYPGEMIKSVAEKLSPGSLFIITTPNCLGFDMTELGSSSTSLGYLYIHLFNPKALTRLLEKNSFEVVDIATPGILDVDIVRRAYANAARENADHLSPWLKEILLAEDGGPAREFQKFLSDNLLSSHLWIVARKK